ncbi:MAG: DUF541 domain-containing protein [Candidatus Staskawiczbacteria bacterium]|nr:DUF541 domain-containing protein [Candidatus Staskawiczbacteria bacterium]
METNLQTSHTLDFSDRVYKVVIAFIAVLALTGAGWVFLQFSGLPQNMPQQISVSGIGKAYVKSDIAAVSFGVTTQELKSQDAVNKNNEKMNAVIKAIKDLGIEDKDIQTTLYNLTPLYDYPSMLMPSGNGGSVKPDMGVGSSPVYIGGGRVFSGYSLEQQISVKIRNFDKINSVLDGATSMGATNVGQLQFTVDNLEKANAEARVLAISNAKEKMQNLAKQSGLRVGKLINVYEGYNNYPVPMYAMGMTQKDSVSVAPEIQAGQQEINLTVTLTYQVK